MAYRDDDKIEYVHGNDDLPDGLSLVVIHATFPIDKSGLDALLDDTDELVLTVNVREYVVYRFIAGDGKETDIVLRAGTQVASPAFELTLWNVLEEKW